MIYHFKLTVGEPKQYPKPAPRDTPYPATPSTQVKQADLEPSPEAEHSLRWQPGTWGKGTLFRDGSLHTWPTESHRDGEGIYDHDDGWPFHGYYQEDMGLEHKKVEQNFAINPEGAASYSDGYHEHITSIEPQLKKHDGWHFGATDTDTYEIVHGRTPGELGHYGDKPNMLWKYRRPFAHDRDSKKIYVGQPGTHHIDLAKEFDISKIVRGGYTGDIDDEQKSVHAHDNNKDVENFLADHLGYEADAGQWNFAKVALNHEAFGKWAWIEGVPIRKWQDDESNSEDWDSETVAHFEQLVDMALSHPKLEGSETMQEYEGMDYGNIKYEHVYDELIASGLDWAIGITTYEGDIEVSIKGEHTTFEDIEAVMGRSLVEEHDEQANYGFYDKPEQQWTFGKVGWTWDTEEPSDLDKREEERLNSRGHKWKYNPGTGYFAAKPMPCYHDDIDDEHRPNFDGHAMCGATDADGTTEVYGGKDFWASHLEQHWPKIRKYLQTVNPNTDEHWGDYDDGSVGWRFSAVDQPEVPSYLKRLKFVEQNGKRYWQDLEHDAFHVDIMNRHKLPFDVPYHMGYKDHRDGITYHGGGGMYGGENQDYTRKPDEWKVGNRFANDEPKLIQMKGEKPTDGYEHAQRIPFIHLPDTNEVYLGQKGWMHNDITTAVEHEHGYDAYADLYRSGIQGYMHPTLGIAEASNYGAALDPSVKAALAQAFPQYNVEPPEGPWYKHYNETWDKEEIKPEWNFTL